MSGANPPANPSQGATVETAAADIERLLDRESGNPAGRRSADAPRRAAAPAAADPPRQPPEPAQPETPPTPEAEDDVEVDDDAADRDAEDGTDADDADDEGEDGAEEEASDEAEAAPDDTPRFTVKVDGKEQKVSLKELTESYHRTADYTRKTTSLAREREAFQAHEQQVRKEREQYQQLLPALAQQLQELQQPNIDWEQLYQQNPAEYVRQQALKREIDDRLAANSMEQHRLQTIAANEQRQQHARLLLTEREQLHAAMPQWKDAEAWKQARERIRTYGLEKGWTDEQLGGVTDHRAVLTLWHAMRGEEMERQLKQKPVPRPAQHPVAQPPRPGPSTVRRSTQTPLARAKQRLSRTHSLADAAKAIERLL